MYESSHWFIGRELEALRLESFITEIISGGQGILVIEDPTAAGESLFLQKHLAQLVRRPLQIISGSGVQAQAPTPGYLLSDLSKYISQPGQWSKPLGEYLEFCVDEISHLFPGLNLKTKSQINLPNESPAVGVDQVAAHLAKIFSLLASESGPLLLVLDNFQWADVLTKQVIKAWLDSEAKHSRYFGVIICSSDKEGDHLSYLNKDLLADYIQLRPFTAANNEGELANAGTGSDSVAAAIFRHFSELNRMQQVLQQKNTELIEAERKAQLASKAKSEFLANMSHEIRTPLNGVMGTISLLQSTPLTKEQKTLIEALETSSENLYRIVNDILDLSKIEAGRQTLQSETLWLSDIVLQCFDLFRGSAEKKNISLQYDISKLENLKVMGDSMRIRQILANLMTNAIKFTDAGSVLVNAGNEIFADHVKYRLEVIDTGVGIAENDLKKLFQNFSQLDISPKKKAPGTGLGLSICQKLVELMGGEIGLHSEKGKGSTFWFEIKLKREQELPAKSLQRSNELHIKWDKLKILVAEDNQVNQLIIRKMLEGLKCEVMITENGEKFIEQIKAADYDLAFLDCQMPVVDGFDACKRLRSEKIKTPPIIALTAYALESDRQRCLDAGMDDYLAKPVKAEMIREMMEKWYRPHLH